MIFFRSYLERGGSLFVLGHQVFAVATPRRVELDNPDAVAVHHLSVEVAGREIDDVISGRVEALAGGCQAQQHHHCGQTRIP